MFTRRDHFSDASQTNVAAQIDLATAFGNALLESGQRFLELHLSIAQASALDMESFARSVLAARTPQEAAALIMQQTQAVSRKTVAYGCHTAGIVAGTQSELTDLFGRQISETNTETIALLADVSRNAPLGLNRVMGFMRVVFDHANAGYEQVSQVSRQVMDAIENSLIAAANQFARTA